MSRDKQIDEMAKVLCEDCARDVAPCILNRTGRRCNAVMEQAKALYNAGYLKASDVAEEIFAEIATILRHHDMLAERDKSEYGELIVMDIGCAISELKKKYTESEKDNG